MTEQEINNLIDSKIGKVKMSQLPEATQTSGLYSIGYTGNQSVKYKANLLQGDPLTVRKTYQTEALALADKNPIDPTTSIPLTVGQFVSIVDDGEKNGIYRISSISGDGTMALELQGKLGDLSDYAKKVDVEFTSNKQNSLAPDGTGEKYATVDAVIGGIESNAGVFNVNSHSSQNTFATQADARGAVPEGYRKKGMIITYKLGAVWVTEQYLNLSTVKWLEDEQWVLVGNIIVDNSGLVPPELRVKGVVVFSRSAKSTRQFIGADASEWDDLTKWITYGDKDYINASFYAGFNTNLSSAIASIPVFFRKHGLLIRFKQNGVYNEYQFNGSRLDLWLVESEWVKASSGIEEYMTEQNSNWAI